MRREFYVSECPDTGRQFLVETGRDGNLLELTPAIIAKLKKLRAWQLKVRDEGTKDRKEVRP